MAGLFGLLTWRPYAPGERGCSGERLDRLLADRPCASWQRVARMGDERVAFSVIGPAPREGAADIGGVGGADDTPPVQDLGVAAIGGHRDRLAAVIAGGPASAFLHTLLREEHGAAVSLPAYPCAALRWDGDRLEIRLDELGAWPLYLRRLPDGVAVATSALSLARLPPVRDLDPAGIAELLTLGQLLGTRTLYEDVEALPPGARYTITADRLERGRERPADTPVARRSVNAAADEIFASLDAVVARDAERSDDAPGVLLSGGVDSRLVLAMLVQRRRAPRAFTFGQPGCADERYARRVASAVDVPHEVTSWTPDGFARVLEHGVALTDGHVSALHFTGTDVLPALRAAASSQWNGFAGDAVLGGSFAHPRHALPGARRVADRLFGSLTTVLLPEELGRVLDTRTAAELAAHPRAAFERALGDVPAGAMAERVRRFLLDQRVGRLAAAGLALDRHYLPVRTPFAEGPVLHAMHRMRMVERRFGRALGHVLVRHFPDLATIPWQRTGARPGTPWPIAASVRAGWRLWTRLGRARGPALADYTAWLDGPLAPMRRAVLSSSSLRDRPVFSADALTRLGASAVGSASGAALTGVLMSIAIAAEILDGTRQPIGELED